MKLRVEFEQETDGRWIAEVAELPGVLAYGNAREEALAAIEGTGASSNRGSYREWGARTGYRRA
jgi:hypothetical protein